MYCVGSVLVGGSRKIASAGSFPECETRSLFSKSFVRFWRLQPPFRFVGSIVEDKAGCCQMVLFIFFLKMHPKAGGWPLVRWPDGA
jgi:hypothetical protein